MLGYGMVGRRFGRLTVVEDLGVLYSESGKYRKRYSLCLCDCGKTIKVLENSLKKGNTKSCGCLFLDTLIVRNTTHGQSKTLLFKLWQGIISRCEIPSANGYENYGGRGIRVCDQWRCSFERFRQDVGERPTPRHSLDRIDNEKGYEPENVRWATPLQQARNSRRVRLIDFGGVTATLSEWSRAANLDYKVIAVRLAKGWGMQRTLTTPTRLTRQGGFSTPDIIQNVKLEIRKSL